jgi:hypothetical protein
MAALLYKVAVLCAFLTLNTVSGSALPENALQRRSNDSPNGIENSPNRRDVAVNATEGTEGIAAASTVIIISIDETTTVTSTQPTLSATSQSGAAVSSGVYTPPSQPFALSTITRLFPTSAITTFSTPTFVSTETLYVTETVTTLYVIDPTRTSTIIGYELAATVTTVTSTGYNCASTNPAPSTATKVLLSGISKSSLCPQILQGLKYAPRSFWIRNGMRCYSWYTIN